MALPLDRLLNLTYFYATENAEESEKDQFDIKLHMPDKKAREAGTISPDSPWAPENEKAALAGFVASLSGGGE